MCTKTEIVVCRVMLNLLSPIDIFPTKIRMSSIVEFIIQLVVSTVGSHCARCYCGLLPSIVVALVVKDTGPGSDASPATQPSKIGRTEPQTVTAAQGFNYAFNVSDLFSMMGVNGHLARQLRAFLSMDLARPLRGHPRFQIRQPRRARCPSLRRKVVSEIDLERLEKDVGASPCLFKTFATLFASCASRRDSR